MLISPFKILNSSGNSSKLVDLKNLPNLVNLIESESNSPFSSFSSVIVRNLYILKIFSFKPGRSCLNNIGLPSLNRTSIATINNNGDNAIIAISDNTKSINLLKYFLYMLIRCSGFGHRWSVNDDAMTSATPGGHIGQPLQIRMLTTIGLGHRLPPTDIRPPTPAIFAFTNFLF